MKNVICLRHPTYCGEGNPELSCKTCCEIYIARIVANSSSLSLPHKEAAERWAITKSQREQRQADGNLDTITFLI